MAKDIVNTAAHQVLHNHLQTALNAGYALGDLVPLIPVGATLRPAITFPDGSYLEPLELGASDFGKTPGMYRPDAKWWKRRSKWNSTSITQQDVLIHDAGGSGLGLKQGVRVVSLDIDITNEAVMQAIRATLGNCAPIRVGRHPKALYLFRVKGEPIKWQRVLFDDKHLIEVLGVRGTGNPTQAAALGMHPSGSQYTWEGGSLPGYDHLPTIDQAGMDHLLSVTVDAAVDAGLVMRTYGSVAGDDANTSNMGLTAEPELAAVVMAALPNDGDWESWKIAGLALFNAVGPNEGWPIWDAWSRKSDKYREGVTAYTWDKGIPNNNRTSGIGSLVHLAREANGGEVPFPVILERAFLAGMPQIAPVVVEPVGLMPPGVLTPMPNGLPVDEWSGVEPLDVMSKPMVPGMPMDLIPTSIIPLVEQEAPAMGVPAEIIFGSCMLGITAAISDEMEIKPHEGRRWTEQARLWMMIIGDASIKKTPGMKLAFKPLNRIDAEKAVEDGAKIASHKNLVEIHRKACKDFVNGKEDAQEPGVEPAHPTTRRMMFNDSTVAKISDILQHNPRGLTMLRDELAGWLSEVENGKDRAEWLELYNGGGRLVERIARGSVHVPNWSASILGAIQPERLTDIMSKASQDGLLQRFYPIVADKAFKATNAVVGDEAMREYGMIVDRLSRAQVGTVSVSPEARAILDKAWDQTYALIEGGTLPSQIVSHLSKWEGGIYRWALVLHCIQCANLRLEPATHLVSEQTAHLVARLHIEYFLPHVMSLYNDVLGDSGDVEHIRWIAGHILAHPEYATESLTLRLIGRGYKHKWPKMDDTQKRRILRYLEDCGWITPKAAAFLPNSYSVNPAIWTVFKEMAEQERNRRKEIIAGIGR